MSSTTDPQSVAQAVFQAADAHDLDALRAHPGLYETVQLHPWPVGRLPRPATHH